ncbi:MAG: lyase family protein, partial [Deltaproteobacteria bacterium]|nr:lyase family protein [Deltaproteobacteria bacterium]
MAREKKLWGGRFAAQTASSVEAFASSIDVDSRLYRQDIAGSIAHARMLARQRIISAREGQKIVRGLKAIQKEIESGDFHFSSADEDIHMNIERRLTQRIGPAGEKLHTARSRNDQVALDMRLYLREELEAILKVVEGLKLELARAAKRYLKVIMPGYTHLQ